ncbi:hypothetical protein [Streptomyces sp. GSL17-111]|uniref:hypothetical protein n=1 Tax=Streptomyces sp. GSL17-111 TaxID=3121596 RepID=UPI0030F3CE5C
MDGAATLSLHGLEVSMPALISVRRAQPQGIDWDSIAQELGIEFPNDYMALSEFYPGLVIDDWLAIQCPRAGSEGRFVDFVKREAARVAGLRDAGMTRGYVPYPEESGLVPWADSIDGDVLHFRTSPKGGDHWTVVVSSCNDDWCEFEGGSTAYLSGLASGHIASHVLPPDFPGPNPGVFCG